jgi:hypothetical protein
MLTNPISAANRFGLQSREHGNGFSHPVGRLNDAYPVMALLFSPLNVLLFFNSPVVSAIARNAISEL